MHMYIHNIHIYTLKVGFVIKNIFALVFQLLFSSLNRDKFEN